MKATVLSNHPVAEGYYRLAFLLSTPLTARPGQFLMIRVIADLHYDPLLPRPFSVYRNPAPGRFEILYKVMGRGTEILKSKREGDSLQVTGPFGNSFPLPSAGEVEEVLLLGGGIGVAPLIMLAENVRRTLGEIPMTVLLGGRARNDLLCLENFEGLNCRIVAATEDGSFGIKGFITEGLDRYLAENVRGLAPAATENRFRVVYACGPHPMLKALAAIVLHAGIPAWFSLEAAMACGMGLCMGCAEKGTEEVYPLVCQDGPVFGADAIQW